ncbi:MAG TPA: hypothetical protein VHV76_14750 [Mycobacteriales bacterium]|jgi:hypothetical protein|nr:hypothetical protein [Mycobacteriales bacterium]
MTSTVSDNTGGRMLVAAPRRRLRDLLSTDGLDLRNTWQVVAGAIMLPVGIAVIVLGWYGAAHGRVDQQQIPYLISGGILGLSFVMIGGFFFWAHWLYRIYDQADFHHLQLMQAQAEQHQELVQALVGRVPEAAVTTAAARASATTSARFVATASGTNFHTSSCPIVSGKSGLRSISAAQARGMKPCRICEPIT